MTGPSFTMTLAHPLHGKDLPAVRVALGECFVQILESSVEVAFQPIVGVCGVTDRLDIRGADQWRPGP